MLLSLMTLIACSWHCQYSETSLATEAVPSPMASLGLSARTPTVLHGAKCQLLSMTPSILGSPLQLKLTYTNDLSWIFFRDSNTATWFQAWAAPHEPLNFASLTPSKSEPHGRFIWSSLSTNWRCSHRPRPHPHHIASLRWLWRDTLQKISP